MVIVKAGEKAFSLLSGRFVVANKNTESNAGLPLLRLPIEVKDMIYHLVLDNWRLHIVYTDRVRSDESNTIVTANECRLVDLNNREHKRCNYFFDSDYVDDHQKSKCSLAEPEDTSCEPPALLRVCQQLYSETALLSFGMCTFSFRTLVSCTEFLECLQPVQRCALRKIELMGYSSWSIRERQPYLKKLTGLRELSIHLRLSDSENEELLKFLTEEVLQVLEKLSLSRFNICVSLLCSDDSAVAADFEALIAIIEQRVLRPKD